MAKAVAFYAADGATQIVDEELADILAGATDTPVKVAVKNTGTIDFGATFKVKIQSVGASDGAGQLRIAQDPNTLSPPWGVVGVVSAPAAGGVWGATGTYGAVVTAVNATGETIRSVQATATVTDTTQTVNWAWEEVTGAAGYRLYRTASPGTYATPSLIADESTLSSSSVTDFDDDGTAAASGAPPSANTTGGLGPDYLTPTTLGLGPVTLGAFAVGQWMFVQIGRVVPSNADDSLNPRFAALTFTEA